MGQAGKFNNNYSEEDRQEYLTTLLRERIESVADVEVCDSTQLNEMISRSPEEFEMFQQMDAEVSSFYFIF